MWMKSFLYSVSQEKKQIAYANIYYLYLSAYKSKSQAYKMAQHIKELATQQDNLRSIL